ncbi:MAG: 3-isopropylmalate dehydratase small subunit [Ignavibacteria bacterium]|nr:3-isopropylmalate dehydratase small subunit [Ignavibacteria bacterium]
MIKGNVHKYGDNIDTDVIIPARYCTAFTEKELAPHALEDLDENFVKKVQKGDIIVAGRNFGCGSSRENAPIAIKGAGVSCVVAKSFARIFYRNSINIGLPILECDTAVDETENGDALEVDLTHGEIKNVTKNKTYAVPPFPAMIQEIINVGGMVEFAKRRIAEKRLALSNQQSAVSN